MKNTYITAKTNKQALEIAKEYRANGYNFVTFFKGFYELESKTEFVIIEKK